MPELPEVETMRRGIAAIVGGRIQRVWVPRSKLRPIKIAPPLRSLRRRVAGRTVVAVGRAGKRLLVELDSGDRIAIEPRMTGRVLLTEPPDRTHLRLVIDLSGTPAKRLLFWDSRGLGVVRLLSAEESARELGPEKLGPDALEISPDQLRERLHKSRRAVKVALLDQRALAGIGNLYASEILHRAALHPAIPCNRLRPGDWKRVHARIRDVLHQAIDLQGSTLGDGTYRTAENQPGGFQDCLRVYQRAGQACLQCGKASIARIVQAQRSTFFCPVCQPPRRQMTK
jgi:formamidopyrimidine-DNA glycosylase